MYSPVRLYISIRSRIVPDFMVIWLPESHMVGTLIHPGSVDALSFIQTMISVLLGSQTWSQYWFDPVTVGPHQHKRPYAR